MAAAAYGLSEAVDPVYPEMRERVAFFRGRSAEVEAVTVGNSHGMAVDFAALGVRGAHLWGYGHDPLEAAYAARYAAGAAPRLRYVLLAASPGFEREDHGVPTGRDRTELRREAYARLPRLALIDRDPDLWVRGMLAPLVRADHWRGVARAVVRPRSPVLLGADGAPRRPPPPPHTPGWLSRSATRRAALHDSIGRETTDADPTTPSRVAAATDALARRLGARGVRLVIYTPPYHPHYLRARGSAAHRETQALLAAIVRRHANVVLLDYATDPRFVDRGEYFHDGDHLSPHGARRFSALLGRCLDALAAGAPSSPAPPGCPAPRTAWPSVE